MIGLKLSPYSDPGLLTRVATAIRELETVGYVALSNTFPNALILDSSGHSVITTGLAGLSGLAMKPIALGQVWQFAAVLEGTVDIVGVGGVTTGADIIDFQNAGAKAVQASKVFWNANEDPGVYSDILTGFVDLQPLEG